MFCIQTMRNDWRVKPRCEGPMHRTVVVLNDEEEVQKEPFASELNYLKEEGIEVVRIPVKLGGIRIRIRCGNFWMW